MRRFAGVVMAAFVITLAIIVGTRMSTEAMAVVIGVVCGVGAGIPTSLLVVAVTNRRTGERVQAQPRREYPPVVVIQPGQGSSAFAQLPYFPPMGPTARARNFHVVGEDTEAIPTDWKRLH